RLGGDGDQRIGERIERLDRLGLGRLDQHPLLDREREVDRGRVEALVDQALRDVERPDAGPLLEARCGGAAFVLAASVAGVVVRYGTNVSPTPTGPAPGPPPPCGVEKVLWTLKCMTSKPASPGLNRPRIALRFAPSI